MAALPDWFRAALAEQLAMRAEPNEFQYVRIFLEIDQQQIWAKMAFPVSAPVPGKCVVSIGQWQRTVRYQSVQNRDQKVVQRLVPRIGFYAAVVPLEAVRAINRPRSARP